MESNLKANLKADLTLSKAQKALETMLTASHTDSDCSDAIFICTFACRYDVRILPTLFQLLKSDSPLVRNSVLHVLVSFVKPERDNSEILEKALATLSEEEPRCEKVEAFWYVSLFLAIGELAFQPMLSLWKRSPDAYVRNICKGYFEQHLAG